MQTFKVRLGFGEIGRTYYGNDFNKNEILVPFKPEEWELIEYQTTENMIEW